VVDVLSTPWLLATGTSFSNGPAHPARNRPSRWSTPIPGSKQKVFQEVNLSR
jgi:hypothetical protein